VRRVDWQLGRLLRVFLDRRLYRLMEFPSVERYVTERLGLSARKARALVALERKTWQADAFGTAYRAGELSWVRALTVLPIMAEPTAAAWVERAGAVPVRRLADEVEWALTVRDRCRGRVRGARVGRRAFPEQSSRSRTRATRSSAGSSRFSYT